ncbi:MAG: nucleotidyltransferase substrate binding protein [Saprospiraceae bacterium]|nr:nucleotidyltransferase substrate binding protein [Saprospiraceae bacterium]MDW8484399.1 nucleotidyltransferase substrate binding protein [Saprospiraceae bacterium]
MPDKDARWIQRFNNFDKALKLLENALQIPNPDVVQKAGIIQFFEMCYELAWKILKDYLEYEGVSEVSTPRNAIKKAFELGIIENGRLWMDMISDRNLASHTYDEQKAIELESLIERKYFPLFKALWDDFKRKADAT